jgi:hypothetical protein
VAVDGDLVGIDDDKQYQQITPIDADSFPHAKTPRRGENIQHEVTKAQRRYLTTDDTDFDFATEENEDHREWFGRRRLRRWMSSGADLSRNTPQFLRRSTPFVIPAARVSGLSNQKQPPSGPNPRATLTIGGNGGKTRGRGGEKI